MVRSTRPDNAGPPATVRSVRSHLARGRWVRVPASQPTRMMRPLRRPVAVPATVRAVTKTRRLRKRIARKSCCSKKSVSVRRGRRRSFAPDARARARNDRDSRLAHGSRIGDVDDRSDQRRHYRIDQDGHDGDHQSEHSERRRDFGCQEVRLQCGRQRGRRRSHRRAGRRQTRDDDRASAGRHGSRSRRSRQDVTAR